MPRRNRNAVALAPTMPRSLRHNMIAEYGVGITHDPDRCRCGRH